MFDYYRIELGVLVIHRNREPHGKGSDGFVLNVGQSDRSAASLVGAFAEVGMDATVARSRIVGVRGPFVHFPEGALVRRALLELVDHADPAGAGS